MYSKTHCNFPVSRNIQAFIKKSLFESPTTILHNTQSLTLLIVSVFSFYINYSASFLPGPLLSLMSTLK